MEDKERMTDQGYDEIYQRNIMRDPALDLEPEKRGVENR